MFLSGHNIYGFYVTYNTYLVVLMIQNYQLQEKNKNECDEPSKVWDKVLN